MFEPGNTLGDVHAACIAAMRSHGFSTFMRGHFGHGAAAISRISLLRMATAKLS